MQWRLGLPSGGEGVDVGNDAAGLDILTRFPNIKSHVLCMCVQSMGLSAEESYGVSAHRRIRLILIDV